MVSGLVGKWKVVAGLVSQYSMSWFSVGWWSVVIVKLVMKTEKIKS